MVVLCSKSGGLLVFYLVNIGSPLYSRANFTFCCLNVIENDPDKMPSMLLNNT